ncbi:MAG: peroxiredoxin family protein [Pseudomonadota bacterium]
MFRTLILAAALAFGTLTAKAEQIGPVVGAETPPFEAYAVDGSLVTLDDLEAENGVALVFFRSAGWCPFCKKQLKDINEVVGPLSERGWAVAGVSYDDEETLQAFVDQEGLDYPLLSDRESATITSFGLLNTAFEEGTRAHGVPHPAIVFVRSDGIVAAVLREDGYRNRPAMETLVGTADILQPTGAEG